MKKIFFTVLFLCLAMTTVNAQETEIIDDNTNFSKWKVRFRMITVMPNESATIEVIGGDVDICNAFVPELDFTYFFNENWAAELILATTKHDVEAISTAVGDIELGDVWLLPPTLTFQYHFNGDKLHPYLGAGINYTLFYNVDDGPVADKVDYDNALGFAFQLGMDIDLNDKWFINADFKYLLLNTDVTVNATTALDATVGADVDINPIIAGIGVGMRF
jgi:outer membrane protein